ncbi:hypothetical protein C0J52_08338 [Blattella germanica]|nr:hypothetical protein C0J52_08338 [Blattella germanica]
MFDNCLDTRSFIHLHLPETNVQFRIFFCQRSRSSHSLYSIPLPAIASITSCLITMCWKAHLIPDQLIHTRSIYVAPAAITAPSGSRSVRVPVGDNGETMSFTGKSGFVHHSAFTSSQKFSASSGKTRLSTPVTKSSRDRAELGCSRVCWKVTSERSANLSEPNHKKDECPNKKTTLFVNTQPRPMLLSDVVKGAENGKEKTNVMNMDVGTIRNETTIDDETDTASEDVATKSHTKQNKKHTTETLIMQEEIPVDMDKEENNSSNENKDEKEIQEGKESQTAEHEHTENANEENPTK